MKLRALALLIAAGLLLPGCWDRRETNELSIVQSLGFDWHGGQYVATAEVIDTRSVPTPGSGGAGSIPPGQPETVVLTGHGGSPGLALSDLTNVSSRRVFWPSTEVLLIGEALARHGIDPVINLIEHYAQVPYTPRVFVVRGTAEGLISRRKPGVEISVARVLRLTAQTNHQALSSMYAPRLYQVMSTESQQDHALIVAAVRAVSPRQPTGPAYLYDEEAVLQGGRLAAWLPRENVRQTLWLTDRFVRGFVRVLCPGRPETSGTVRINRAQGQVRPVIDGGRLTGMDIRLNGTGDLMQSCPGATLAQTGRMATAEVRRDTERVVAWAKQHRLDIFGWGEDVFRQDPGLWRRLAPEWPATFARLPVRMRVRVQIHSAGEGRT